MKREMKRSEIINWDDVSREISKQQDTDFDKWYEECICYGKDEAGRIMESIKLRIATQKKGVTITPPKINAQNVVIEMAKMSNMAKAREYLANLPAIPERSGPLHWRKPEDRP